MESETVSKEVLRKYILEYQITQDPELFKKILYRTDDLVLYVVHRCLNRCPHLKMEDPDSVYQTGLVGLYKGVVKVLEHESPDKVIARLIAYMKCEIKSNFPYKVLPETYALNLKKYELGESVYSDLEFEFVDEFLTGLVEKKMVTQLELDLVRLRYRDEISCTNLAAKFQISEATVRVRISNALGRIRRQLKLAGIMEV